MLHEIGQHYVAIAKLTFTLRILNVGNVFLVNSGGHIICIVTEKYDSVFSSQASCNVKLESKIHTHQTSSKPFISENGRLRL